MNVLKKIFFGCVLIAAVFSCTKNGVNGDISATQIQLLNFYNSDKTTFSLLQGNDTVISNVAYGQQSEIASGPPGFYSLVFQDNLKDTLLHGNINLSAGTKYSMFIVQDTTSNTTNNIDYSLITNSTIDPLPRFDSCRVRILNFARGINYTTFRFIIREGTGFGQYSPSFNGLGGRYILSRRFLDNNSDPSKAQYFTVRAIPYDLRLINSGLVDTTKAIDSIRVNLKQQRLYTICLMGKYDSASSANHNYKYDDSLRVKVIEQ